MEGNDASPQSKALRYRGLASQVPESPEIGSREKSR